MLKKSFPHSKWSELEGHGELCYESCACESQHRVDVCWYDTLASSVVSLAHLAHTFVILLCNGCILIV